LGESGFKDINPEPTETIMIPFLNTDMLVNLMTQGNPAPRTLNADYAWYLDTLAVKVADKPRDAWPLRLLPQSLRAPIKARLAARKYERTLIKLWEISPHLITDIGVTFAPPKASEDHLIAAPAGLVAHVQAKGLLPTEPVRQTRPDATAPAPLTPVTADPDRPRTDQIPLAA